MLSAPHHARRGGIYIAVLGSSMLVTLIGLSALMLVRGQRLQVNAAIDTDQARLNAEAGAELAIQRIASDSNWRTTFASGTIANKLPLSSGTYSVTVTDPVDGNLGNRTTDPVVLRCTGSRGVATQILEVTLDPVGAPIDALAMAIHTVGELHITGGNTLTVSGAPASTNGLLRDDGIVAGDAQCLAVTSPGNVTGALTLAATPKAMPNSNVVSLYVGLGTAITPAVNSISALALGPGANPLGGGTNAGGVYVLTINSNVTIQNCRILGTLVIICPGRTVTIQGNVLMQPARPDYPALIVDGAVNFKFDSTTNLSEATLATNFNPTGVPYLSVTDSDKVDTYPSEIGGLVHIKDSLSISAPCTVRGAVICESASSSNAVVLSRSMQVVYDPTLYSSPPMGYTKTGAMAVRPGSWKQAVNP